MLGISTAILLSALLAYSATARASERDPVDLQHGEQQSVLIMHDLDEIPLRDVARDLAIPEGTAKTRLKLGRIDLEVALQQKHAGRFPQGKYVLERISIMTSIGGAASVHSERGRHQ